MGMEEASDEGILEDMVGVTVGVGLEGGEGLSSRVMVRLYPELVTPELLPLTASATTETPANFRLYQRISYSLII